MKFETAFKYETTLDRMNLYRTALEAIRDHKSRLLSYERGSFQHGVFLGHEVCGEIARVALELSSMPIVPESED